MVDFPHKIIVPQRSDYLVSRPRLNELLATITHQRLITISGPAGYGKTSLLIDFASVSPLPLCWYTLDPFDQDPWVFLDYLVAAIEQRFPGAAARTIALLAAHGRTSFATLVASLVRELYLIGRDFVILIDDWHVVDGIADIKDIVTHLLLYCPHCHVILATRSYPSLPNMMLLTARRQMGSLNENQLRFTAAEVAAVLQAGYDAVISAEQAATLADQSYGWITGILLSFQTAADGVPETMLPRTFVERQIYRYLVEQVFDQQSPEAQSFLLDSALLDELTPEHCDAIFQRADTRSLLEKLLRQHLFIIEIKAGVLRYHPLFREFLLEHYRAIDSQRCRAMALRVADFYRAQGQGLLAFDRYIAAGDQAAAQQVLADNGEWLYSHGRLETLEPLFAALPEQILDARLLCLLARVRLDRGCDAEAQVLANRAELHAGPDDRPVVMLLQAQLARIGGRYEHALDLAQQVLGLTQEPAQRTAALRTIAICHHRLDQIEAAIGELKQALLIERERGDLHTVALLQLDLGLCYRAAGLLNVALDHYTQSDAYWSTIGNTGLQAITLNSKGGVQRLAGQYHEAHATLTTALQHAREAAIPHYQAAVLSSLGDLYCDLQLWERASAAYADARKVGGSAYLMSCLDLSDVRLLFRQRQYDAAARLLRQLPAATQRHLPNEVLLLSGTLACAMGQYDQAEQHAQQLIAMLRQSGGRIDLARAYLLQAWIVACATPNDAALLITWLEQASQIADELGHDAFLIAKAAHMPGLLRHAAALGWARAAGWLQRHQDMRLTMQALDQADQRRVLIVQTLGMDRIIFDGQPVKVGWNKAREVFYYLLAHPDGAPISALQEAIWPERETERGRDALRSAIYQLRSVLPHDMIALHGRQVYRLDRETARLDYDVERFEQLVAAGASDPEALLEALDLYRGPYLSFTDSEWSVGLRTHLEQRYLRVLHRAAAYDEKKSLYADALILYQRILAVDMLDEAAHAGVMRCQIELDNRAAAIDQYKRLRRLLDEELGLDPEPSSEVEHLYRHILTLS